MTLLYDIGWGVLLLSQSTNSMRHLPCFRTQLRKTTTSCVQFGFVLSYVILHLPLEYNKTRICVTASVISRLTNQRGRYCMYLYFQFKHNSWITVEKTEWIMPFFLQCFNQNNSGGKMRRGLYHFFSRLTINLNIAVCVGHSGLLMWSYSLIPDLNK